MTSNGVTPGRGTQSGGPRRARLVWLPILLGLAIGIGARANGLIPLPEIDVEWSIPATVATSYRPDGTLASGGEIALIYVGSSQCVWSNTPELVTLVGNLKLELQARARAEQRGFVAVGIARDMVAANGLEHLRKFGAFDEVTSGRSWANIGLLKYIYGDMPGRAATPQVLVVSRTVHAEGGHYGFRDERVLVRAIGLEDIKAWILAGAPLDTNASFLDS